jgi:hypothetical protein
LDASCSSRQVYLASEIWLRSMNLKIVLDENGFHWLKGCIPRASRSKVFFEDEVRVNFLGSNVVISCNEAEARNLLLYADGYPTVVASIHEAFRSARLPIDTFQP